MKTDKNGCSTCPVGQEHYERYWSPILNAYRIQYDYRTPDGLLFSCIAKTLDDARKRRAAWLEQVYDDDDSFLDWAFEDRISGAEY